MSILDSGCLAEFAVRKKSKRIMSCNTIPRAVNITNKNRGYYRDIMAKRAVAFMVRHCQE